MHTQFEAIRPFHDDEVNGVLQKMSREELFQTIITASFPEKTEAEALQMLREIRSIQDFQTKIIYQTIQQVLAKTSAGFSYSGFDKLEKNTPYLFLSNHRDIILDTSLLNTALCEQGLVMTASAIGDNLVRTPFLRNLAKANRNFIIRRGLPPRELLESSQTVSEYITHLIKDQKRSVWLAQREGRTKDGNDATHPGILKMLAMAAPKGKILSHFKELRIVPVAISYEYDPTDSLKLPELMAITNNEVYVKKENEDFNTIVSGIVGYKKRIHIHASEVLQTQLDELSEIPNPNQQIKRMAEKIDAEIIQHYRLWATNYIAYDLLHHTTTYSEFYTAEEKDYFLERLKTKVDTSNKVSLQHFLGMYANPVANKS